MTKATYTRRAGSYGYDAPYAPAGLGLDRIPSAVAFFAKSPK